MLINLIGLLLCSSIEAHSIPIFKRNVGIQDGMMDWNTHINEVQTVPIKFKNFDKFTAERTTEILDENLIKRAIRRPFIPIGNLFNHKSTSTTSSSTSSQRSSSTSSMKLSNNSNARSTKSSSAVITSTTTTQVATTKSSTSSIVKATTTITSSISSKVSASPSVTSIKASSTSTYSTSSTSAATRAAALVSTTTISNSKTTSSKSTSSIASVASPMKTKAGLALTPKNKYQLWVGTVYIGSPPTAYSIDLDSGSSDLWIPGYDCDTTKNKYDYRKSNTSKATGSNFSIRYHDGSTTSGPVYQDTLTIGGIKIQNQKFAAVNQLTGTVATSPLDGVLGLAYSSISAMGSPPFTSMMAQGLVSSPSFSFKLSQDDSSEFYMGGMNPNKFVAGTTRKYPVISQRYWTISGSLTSNGTILPIKNVIVDTGTTLIITSTKLAETFHAQISGSYLEPTNAPHNPGFWTYPCNSTPPAIFNFGDSKQYQLSQATFNLGRADYTLPARCVSSIVGGNIPDSTVILGDSFLQNVYSTFDFGSNTVGFSTLQ